MGNIYILKSFGEDNNFIYKLGYSLNVYGRLKDYQVLNPLVKLIAIIDIEYPDKWELMFHKMYKSDYRNEWYLEENFINILKPGIYFKGLELINDSNINVYLNECFNKSKLLSHNDKMFEILKCISHSSKVKKYFPEINLTIGQCKLHNPEIKKVYPIKEVNGLFIEDREYTFKELEELFQDEFLNKGIRFNGYALKKYFPEFEKTRKIKHKIRDTYYKFK